MKNMNKSLPSKIRLLFTCLFLFFKLIFIYGQNDALELNNLYNSLGGSNWTDSTNWNGNTSIDTWYGVSTDQDENVICIDMDGNPDCTIASNGGNNINGEFPTLNLPYLRSMHFYYDSIYGSLPDFSGTPSLETFTCSFNYLEGDLYSLESLSNLKYFDGRVNNFTGTMPSFEGQNLIYISLSSNNIEGTIPTFDFDSLVYFNLSRNNIHSEIPTFENDQYLETLVIGGPYETLMGEIPTFNLPNLQRLSLEGVVDTQSFPNISNLVNLNSLTICYSELIGTIPDFSNSPNLSFINLSKNNLNGEVPNFNLPLETIDLGNNNFEGTVPAFENTLLTTLNLQSNNFNALPDFGSLPLTTLVVYNNNLTFEDILPNLDIPYFTYSPQSFFYTDTTISVLPDSSITIDLLIDDTVSNNIYRWFKQGVFFSEETNNKLTIEDFSAINEGVYSCIVTNPLAPKLALSSHPITLQLTTGFSGSINVIQVNSCVDKGILEASTQSGSGDFSFNWSTGDTTQIVSNLDPGTYKVTITDSFFPDIIITDSITLFPQEIQLFDIGPDTYVCEPFLDLQVSGFQNATYLWSTNDTQSSITIQNSDLYAVTVTDLNNGCTGQDSIQVTFSDLSVSFLTDTLNCNTDFGNITAIPSGGTAPYNYFWFTGHQQSQLIDVDNGAYKVTITDANECSVAATVEFAVEPIDTVQFIDYNYQCNNDNTADVQMLLGENLNEFTLLLNQDADPAFDEEINLTGNTFNFTIADGIEWTVQASDIYNCNKITISDLFVSNSLDCVLNCETAEITIPEAITPNNDGYNDNFAISGIGDFPNNELIILNRNGQILFQQSPYLSSAQWDGTFKGSPLPEGTYYYQLKLDDSCPIKTGSVLLLK